MKIIKNSLYLENLFGFRVRFHWSLIPAMFLFSGMNFQPVYFLSFLVLVLFHEIGHALIVKSFSFRNHELIIHGLGGACVWSGSATQKQLSIISWGGILAQLVIFTTFLILPKWFTIPQHEFIDQIFRAFISTNLLLIVINLIPYDPLDGAQAWKLFSPIWNDFKSLKNRQKNNRYQKVDDQIIQILNEYTRGSNKDSKQARSPSRRKPRW